MKSLNIISDNRNTCLYTDQTLNHQIFDTHLYSVVASLLKKSRMCQYLFLFTFIYQIKKLNKINILFSNFHTPLIKVKITKTKKFDSFSSVPYITGENTETYHSMTYHLTWYRDIILVISCSCFKTKIVYLIQLFNLPSKTV